MIKKSLKADLDQLKNIISEQKSVSWSLSYGEVISYLVNEFKKNPSMVRKKYSTKVRSGLFVSIPLNKIELNVGIKLEKKNLVSYNVSP